MSVLNDAIHLLKALESHAIREPHPNDREYALLMINRLKPEIAHLERGVPEKLVASAVYSIMDEAKLYFS